MRTTPFLIASLFIVSCNAGAPSTGIPTGNTDSGKIGASVSLSTVSSNLASVFADGTSQATITVKLVNSDSVPVPNKTVTLSGTSGIISPASATTDSSGNAVFAVSDAALETVVVTARDQSDAITLTQTASIQFVARFTKVANYGTGSHSCALTPGGNVYCWGFNATGQLGNNSTINSQIPVAVLGMGGTGKLASVTALGLGESVSCAVSNGNVYCWGYNHSGQLGNNSMTDSHTPVEVVGVGGSGFLANVTAVASGTTNTCAISGGNVYCWGDNSYGQLGNNTIDPSLTPSKVLGLNGTGFLSSITSVAVTNSSACALSSGGNVFCWGFGGDGELGYNSFNNSFYPVQVTGVGGSGVLSSVASLTGGDITMCSTSTAGNVYCWGSGAAGVLGNMSTSDSSVPVEAIGVGGSGFLGGVGSVSVGDNSTCAVSTGKVFCWGNGAYGALGNNSASTSMTPVQASGISNINFVSHGRNFSCAVSATGNAYCWGDNSVGALGNTLVGTVSFVPVPVL